MVFLFHNRGVRHILDNDNILSNRFNPILGELALTEVYSRILSFTDIAGLSALLNHLGGSGSNPEISDDYYDSKFCKVG
jgi:hypothetical protein